MVPLQVTRLRAAGLLLARIPDCASLHQSACGSCYVGAANCRLLGLPVARGDSDATGARNTPTLLNTSYNAAQFWDGHRPDLESQALDPLLNSREPGLPDLSALLDLFRRDHEYVTAFQHAFPRRLGAGWPRTYSGCRQLPVRPLLLPATAQRNASTDYACRQYPRIWKTCSANSNATAGRRRR